MLSEPPKDLLSYNNQNEVVNYILDKAFVEYQLTDEHVYTIQNLFQNSLRREHLLTLLENDYQSYQLDYLQPHYINLAKIKVKLPSMIYGNLQEIFLIFLQCLSAQHFDQCKKLKNMP